MNPLTLVKRIQNINSKEAQLGISEDASWHAKYKDSAYVFVGGIPFDLTEGDLLAVFSQYGEIVDVNLVRDKGTGKSKGYAFIAYEDQRSTNLAVDNLNGAQILGRVIRVDHVSNYKKKEEEDEATEQQKREARGVCRAFQRGECTRGAGCKFSHDEQRAANTGWGRPEDESSRWGHDKFGGPNPKRNDKNSGKQSDRMEEKRSRWNDDNEMERKSREGFNRREEKKLRRHEEDEFVLKSSEDRGKREEKRSRRHEDEHEAKLKEDDYRREEKRSRRHEEDKFVLKPSDDCGKREEKRSRRHEDEYEAKSKEYDYRREEKRSRRHDDEIEPRSRGDNDRREEKKSRRQESDSYIREDRERRGGDKTSTHGRDSSSRHQREKDDYRHKSER